MPEQDPEKANRRPKSTLRARNFPKLTLRSLNFRVLRGELSREFQWPAACFRLVSSGVFISSATMRSTAPDRCLASGWLQRSGARCRGPLSCNAPTQGVSQNYTPPGEKKLDVLIRFNKNIRIFLNFFSKMSGSKTQVFCFSGGPGGFREVRGPGRNHFHLSWYLRVPGVTSYKCQVFFPGGCRTPIHPGR